MLSNFNEWLQFHIDILEKRRLPFFIWSFGLFSAFLGMTIYENILFKLNNSILFSKLVVDNIDTLKHGLWIVPLIILLFFWFIGLTIHKSNIREIFGLKNKYS